MTYPTKQEVGSASLVQLLTWHRFLPSPPTDEKADIIRYIGQRMSDLCGVTPSVSKQLGWGD